MLVSHNLMSKVQLPQELPSKQVTLLQDLLELFALDRLALRNARVPFVHSVDNNAADRGLLFHFSLLCVTLELVLTSFA